MKPQHLKCGADQGGHLWEINKITQTGHHMHRHCSAAQPPMGNHQGLIDLGRERACNSACACRDGKMLVFTKNRTKLMGSLR